MLKTHIWTVITVFLLSTVATVGAQDVDEFEPSVVASDQVATGGVVTVDSVTSDGPGWLVIHAAETTRPAQ